MFTDIHNHIIYGVDDGASRREETFAMIDAAVKDGVSTIISTPHITPGEYEFHDDLYERHFEFAQDYIREKGYDLTLYTGAEILFTPYTARMLREKRVRTLANTRYVLLEFSPTDQYDHLLEAARTVGNAGFEVVFAHIERYDCLYKHYDRISELKDEYNVLMQMNARTVFRKLGLFRQKYVNTLLQDGYIDFIATDTHNMPERNTCMTEAYERLKQLVGQERADALTGGNQKLILG